MPCVIEDHEHAFSTQDLCAPVVRMKEHDLFFVRVVDLVRQTFTIVCETCGAELPIGALNLIDSDAVGAVMLEHSGSQAPFDHSSGESGESSER